LILSVVLTIPVAQAYADLQVTRRPMVYVKDANSQATIQGASVYLDGVSIGTTDSGGGLTIMTADMGVHQLSVGKGGYNTYQTTIDITPSMRTFTAYLTTSPTPVYTTGFEDVTKRDANRLNMGIDNWFEFQGDGGAAMWMEGLDRKTPDITCHSGSRCVGLELTDAAKSYRNDFVILNLQNLVGDELFVSVWLYLPADWRLHAPNINWNWYEIANPFFEAGPSFRPYAAIHIIQPDITKGTFNMKLDVRDTSNALNNYGNIPNYPLLRGRWFNLQYYVYRHETNGIVKVWIDGTLLFDARNISTKNPSTTGWSTHPAKIYYESELDAFSPYRIWADDLEIYNRMT